MRLRDYRNRRKPAGAATTGVASTTDPVAATTRVARSTTGVAQSLPKLAADEVNDELPGTMHDRIREISSRISRSGIQTVTAAESEMVMKYLGTSMRSQDNFSSLMPMMFRLTMQDAFSLANYKPMHAFYSFMLSTRTLLRTGRQVSKSTNLAYKKVFQAATIPNYKMLFVAPLFEQTRRFSHNYVKPAIDLSLLKGTIVDSTCEQNVLQKSFRNGSKLFFTYCFRECDRARGIAADELCLVDDTPVLLPDGTERPIQQVRAGDRVIAVDKFGTICEDVVDELLDRGIKPVYRVTLQDGRYVDCTETERFLTLDGWRRLRDLVGGRLPDGVGDVVGRRVHVVEQDGAVSCEARDGAGRVLRPQSRAIGPVDRDPAEDGSQPRMGRVLQNLYHAVVDGVRSLSRAVLPRRPQAGDSRLVERTDVEGSGVLVHGRRWADGGEPTRDQHAGVHQERMSVVGGHSDRTGMPDVGTAGAGPRGDSVCPHDAGGIRENLPGPDRAVHARDPQIQIEDLTAGPVTVLTLRGGVHGANQPGGGQVSHLRRREMCAGSEQATEQEVSGRRQTGTEANEKQGDVRCEFGGQQEEQARGRGTSSPRESGKVSGVQESVEGPEEGPELVPGVVVSVQRLPDARVWDINTRVHHSFFANGVVVHNCVDEIQDIDVTFLPILRECLSASRYRIETFAGTPKTLDNTICSLWGKSSQGEWIMTCGACHKDNIPSIAEDMLKMIGPKGLICAKCGRPLNCRDGRWIHKFPDRIPDFFGLHIPQPILPLHSENPRAWKILLDKMNTQSKRIVWNECLGEDCDAGSKLITMETLKARSVLPFKNGEESAPGYALKAGYLMISVGVDWGGRGEAMDSLTAISVVGLRHDGHSDVIFAMTMPPAEDDHAEIAMVKHIFGVFRAKGLGHDFNGVGMSKDSRLIDNGFKMSTPWAFVTSNATFFAATCRNPTKRVYVKLNRSAAITLLAHEMANGRVSLPRWEDDTMINPFLDFNSWFEDTVPQPDGRNLYRIMRSVAQPDDVGMATIYAMLTNYRTLNKWPRYMNSLTPQGITVDASYNDPKAAMLDAMDA